MISAYALGAGRFATLFEDVTERRAADAARSHSEGQVKSLVDNVPDIVFEVDREYRLVTANELQRRAAIATQGRAIEVGESMLGADYPEEQVRTWRERFDRALAGESFVVERAQAYPEGMHHSEDHFTPVRESDGVVSGVVVTSHDVTARKQAENDVRRLNAELEAARRRAHRPARSRRTGSWRPSPTRSRTTCARRCAPSTASAPW